MVPEDLQGFFFIRFLMIFGDSLGIFKDLLEVLKDRSTLVGSLWDS